MDYHSNYLYHHGIKGMKWGVRRFQNKDGTRTPLGRKRYYDKWSDDAKEHYRLKQKRVKELSNAEIRKYNERARLEQDYSKLNPNLITAGLAVAATLAIGMETVNKVYNNSKNLNSNIGKMVRAGKKVAEKMLSK